MKTLSRKPGRPKSDFHAMMKGPLDRGLKPEGCAATRRNAGYMLYGMDIINRAGLLDAVTGTEPKWRRGTHSLFVELGRWKTGDQDLDGALAIVRDGLGALTETARRLRRLRLGEPEAEARDVRRMFAQTVTLIRRKFPGIETGLILEGLDGMAQILHEERYFDEDHATAAADDAGT